MITVKEVQGKKEQRTFVVLRAANKQRPGTNPMLENNRQTVLQKGDLT